MEYIFKYPNKAGSWASYVILTLSKELINELREKRVVTLLPDKLNIIRELKFTEAPVFHPMHVHWVEGCTIKLTAKQLKVSLAVEFLTETRVFNMVIPRGRL